MSKNILGISINTINSKFINQTPRNGLKYFYEPKANSVEEIHKEWLPFVAKYTINKDSLNERFDYEESKPKGVIRIITLGDSYTFGENVNTKDNYPEQLEDLLNIKCSKNIFEVINLGVYGYDIQYMRERYLKRGAKYQPDLVIMMFADFQLFRLNEELGKRVEERKKIDSHIDIKTAYINSSTEMISDFGWNQILEWQKYQVDQLTNSIKSNKLILKFPVSCSYAPYNWYTQSFECWPFITYNNLFKEVSLKKNNTYFINDIIRYKEHFLEDGHPNIEGHKAIAEYILSYLLKFDLISCN